MMDNFKLALSVFSAGIGLLIGQWSTFYAMHPERIRDEAYRMAGVSYRAGCVRAGGNHCVSQAYDFEEALRKYVPIDEIEVGK